MAAGDIFLFGPYRLIPAERLLLRGGEVVGIGHRALDVLIALTEAAGQILGHRELLARAWPHAVVSEGNLRVTIAGLRKALGDGQEGARYIANVAGRGYCFVAPVGREAAQPPASGAVSPPLAPGPAQRHKLPVRLTHMIGRDDAVEALLDRLLSRRFVSVVGPGGMGKTTVAVSVAHALLHEFGQAVYFVDLGVITDASLVTGAIATVLGVSIVAHDPFPSLRAFLTGRRILLVFDNCEHVIDAVAALTERLYSELPQVHILTTSREALRVKGEHIYLLRPLACPSARENLTAAEALTSPAVQLFMDRASASGYSSSLTDANAAIVAAMCSRLDGIALAIELAASQVGVFGLHGTADLLNNRLRLLWQGRRSAPPRQQTLHATLDWSFNLLSDRDRRVLYRLSIFIGVFTLEAAQAVAIDNQIDAAEVTVAIASLNRKSLVWVASTDGTAHYRLLDSTLAYAAEKLTQAGEANTTARLHALYFTEWCRGRSGRGVTASGNDVAIAGPHIGNIRAALEWSFSSVGDTIIGVRLAAVAAPLFLKLSLLVECCRWCMQALAALPDTSSDETARLALQEALAASAMFTRGNNDEVRKTIEDALTLAETLGDHWRQLQLLSGLYIFMIRTGDVQGSMAAAQRRIAIGRTIDSPTAIATAEWMLGLAFHLAGDQASALRHLQRGMAEDTIEDAEEADSFCSDHRMRALVGLARVLWFSGFPDQAAKTAQQAIDAAVRRDHSVDLCIAMAYLAPVFLGCGDLDEAEQLIRRLIAHAARHSLGPYGAAGEAFMGELAVARGDPETGVLILRRALGRLQAERYHTLTPDFQRALAEGLMQCGEIGEAAAIIDAALTPGEARAEAVIVPELLRVRGELWLQTKPAEPAAAERAFQLSLQRAKAQSALSLELRSAIGLARLWSSQGKRTDAADLLTDVNRRFTEGYRTTDLQLARQLLSTLGRSAPPLDAASKQF